MATKKIAAGLIAAATLISTPAVGMIAAGTAMADPTTAATITVNGDVAGHTFKAYKIATYGNVQIDGNGAAKLTLTSTDQAKITAAAQSAGITVASGQDPIDAVTRNASAAQVKAFAKALAASGIAQTGQTTTGSGKTATIGNLTEGWYLVTDSKGLPVLVGTQITSNGKTATKMANGDALGTIDIKSTSLSVDKKVNGSDDGSASVGSTVGYTVTIPMPDPANVATLKYKDTLTGGKITDTPTATIDGKTVSISPVVDSNKAGFTVDLTSLIAGNKGKTLVISYHVKTTAKTVTNNAELNGTDTNGNVIDPGHGGGKDTSSVKAYDFDLTKVDSVSTGTKLQGAQFKIQKKNGAWLKQTDGAWADAASEADATVFTTDAQGQTTFTGLGNGDYVVKEVAAPADHYIAGTFTFQATVNNGTTTFSGNNLVSGLDGDSAQVKNNPTVNGLAKTGEGGLLLAGSAAAAMAAIGLGCALAYKRQQAQA